MTNQRPVLTNQRPVLTNKRPVLNNQRLVLINQRPVLTNQRPVLTNQRLVLTNKRPVLPVDHNGDRQGEDEDAREGAEAANQLPQQRLGVKLVTNCGDGHQAPPAETTRQIKSGSACLIQYALKKAQNNLNMLYHIIRKN